MKKILVTDSLFIYDEHVEKLKENGFEVVRLDKPEASEEELVEAIKGKFAYIIGGVEQATNKVIEAGSDLQVITFTGADWVHFVPGHEKATEKGITITNTPGANANTVAEYTVAVIMAMTRNLFELTRTGEKTFETTQSLKDLTVGIVGMGRIGKIVTQMLKGLGVKEVIYYSPNEKSDVDAECVEMDEILKRADVVSLHASSAAGKGYIGEKELSKMKDGALIVDCGFMGGLDQDALYSELEKGRLRGFQDGPSDVKFKDLPLNIWMNSNSHTAFNTFEANRTASDMAVESVLNILSGKEDQYKVN